MKSYKILIITISLIMFSGILSYSADFKSFYGESDQTTAELRCKKSKVTPASNGWGALYSCIQGEAGTVKWFINETPGTNKVKNIKFLWNDWFKNIGYGIHPDKQEAQNALNILIKLYAPQKNEEINNAFWGNKDKTIVTNGFIIEYTYYRGSAIDERMIILRRK